MQMTLSKNSTFCRVNSKDEPNSIDVLAKAISLSGINGLDLSSYGQDVLAEAIASSGILFYFMSVLYVTQESFCFFHVLHTNSYSLHWSSCKQTRYILYKVRLLYSKNLLTSIAVSISRRVYLYE